MEAEVQQQPSEKLIRILAFTLIISVMSATMFNIVLPEIRAEFQLSFVQVSSVTSAFLLIYAIGTVIYGKLADIYKLKNLITFGLIFFAFGSMIGLVAHAFWMVLLGRIMQAAGAAVIPATAGIIPVRYFPPESRGRALGIAMTGLAIGGAIGPVVASFLVSAVHWRWLFCFPILTLLTLPYYRKYLDDESGNTGNIDWLGGGLLAGTVAMLLLAITNKAWIPAAGCLMFFLLFVMRIRSAAKPFIHPGLFRNKNYTLGLTIALLTSGIGYSIAFLIPQLLTEANHLAPGLVGLAMVPAAVTTAILGRKAGKLADAKGNPYLFCTASVLLMLCFVLLSSFAGVSPVYIAIFLIFGNVGQSFIMIALSNTISRTLPKDQTGVGMGLLAMINFIAAAVSSSVYSLTLDQGTSMNWNAVNSFPVAFVYSNIYFVLAILHAAILLLYYYQFGRAERKRKAS
ncbi:MFS transporter [Paenibacillus harenae]|uniref:MFS transporter n=1 Tax=Paenibacillus harenae TaxID=306543 RepID=UPI0003F8E241|nr:MFS transporter [Paenibacillus harenae]